MRHARTPAARPGALRDAIRRAALADLRANLADPIGRESEEALFESNRRAGFLARPPTTEMPYH
jgi:hypothetical protein